MKHAIAKYPTFTKLDISLLKEINRFTAEFEPYSDFNATSLYSWDVDNSISLSYLDQNLVISLPDYLDGTILHSILGKNKIEDCIDILIKDFGKLSLVPDVVVNSLGTQEKYKITEDRDSFDYVYDADHLSKLIGGKFKKKRNKHNVFVKAHENYDLNLKVTKNLDDNHLLLIKNIDREWAKIAPRSAGDLLGERKALDRILSSFSSLDLILVEIEVDGEIKAFSINEVLKNGYGICHFEKALKVHHENIYTFLSAEVASILKQHGCNFINWEQDLGLEGLRRSKSSFHPVKMLKKYTIQPIK